MRLLAELATWWLLAGLRLLGATLLVDLPPLSSYGDRIFHIGNCHHEYHTEIFLAKRALDLGYLNPWMADKNFTVLLQSAPACGFTDNGDALLRSLYGLGPQPGRYSIGPNETEVPPVVAISGCGCSRGTSTLALLAAGLGTPIISGSATTPGLSDRSQYPSFMRTIPNDNVQADCMARLIHEFRWSWVAWIVFEDESYGAFFTQQVPALLDSTLQHEVFYLTRQQLSGPSDWPNFNISTVRNDIASRFPQNQLWHRILAFIATPRVFYLIYLLEMMKIGVLNENTVVINAENFCDVSTIESEVTEHLYQWQAVDTVGYFNDPFWENPTAFLKGSWCTVPYIASQWLQPTSLFWQVNERITAEALIEVGAPSDMVMVSMEEWASSVYRPLIFDAALTIFMSISRLLYEGTPVAEIRGQRLLETMYQIKFPGISGDVEFTANGERLGRYVVRNLQVNASMHSMFVEVFTYTEQAASGGQQDVPDFLRANFDKIGKAEFRNGLENTSDVLECDPGHEAVVLIVDGVRQEICKECDAGMVRAATRSGPQTCSSCPPTSFAHTTGQTACSYCEGGTYSNVHGASSCAVCERGTWQDLIAQSHCNLCAPGTFADKEGMRICSACEKGTFQEDHGQTSCDVCPNNLVTASEYAQSREKCHCQEGTYLEDGRCLDAPAGRVCAAGSVLNNCSCDVGKRAIDGPELACRACEDHLHCPGGHLPDWSLPDTTVLIQEGYMTLEHDPYSVYECVSAKVCRGLRSPFQMTGELRMCQDGVALLPRCGRCAAGRFGRKFGTTEEGCEDCGPRNWLIFALKSSLAFLVGLITVIYLYLRFNMPAPSGFITISVIISVIQSLQTFGQLQLNWPDVLQWTFDSMQSFGTSDGFLDVIDLHAECWVGHHYGPNIAEKAVRPLMIFVNFVVLQCIARILGRSLKWDHVHNIIGLVFTRLFISIVRISLSLFYRLSMPNGKVMVTEYPDLEFLSSDWFEVLPISVIATVLYACTTAVYITYLVLTAPVQASDPNFMARARFCFGSFRPDRHWWILVQLAYGFLLNFAQVSTPTSNVHFKLYMTVLFLMTFVIVAFHAQPYKYAENNAVDLMFNTLLVMLLVLATSFIDPAVLSPAELQQWNNTYAVTMVMLLSLGLLWSCSNVIRWALNLIVVQKGEAEGKRAQFGLEFRDCTVAILLLSDQELLRRLSSVGDYDLHKLKDATKTMLSVLLGLQTGNFVFKQRLIPGEPFKRWDYREMELQACEKISTGDLQQQVVQSYRVRAWVLQMAMSAQEEMQRRGTEDAGQLKGDLQHHHVDRLLYALGITDHVSANRPTFQVMVKEAFGHLRIPLEDVNSLFDIIDMNATGMVTKRNFVLVVKALLPTDLLAALADNNPFAPIASAAKSRAGTDRHRHGHHHTHRPEHHISSRVHKVHGALLDAARTGSLGTQDDDFRTRAASSLARSSDGDGMRSGSIMQSRSEDRASTMQTRSEDEDLKVVTAGVSSTDLKTLTAGVSSQVLVLDAVSSAGRDISGHLSQLSSDHATSPLSSGRGEGHQHVWDIVHHHKEHEQIDRGITHPHTVLRNVREEEIPEQDLEAQSHKQLDTSAILIQI